MNYLKLENLYLNETESRIIFELGTNLRNFFDDKIVKIVLFGSKARSEADLNSDIDIAIILKGLTRELKRKVLDMVADLELKYLTPISSLVISIEEYQRLLTRERRIALDIEREGIVI